MNTTINDNIFQHFPLLETDRLILRQFHLDDASALFNIRSNDKVMEFMDTKAHDSVEDVRMMITEVNESFSKHEGIYWAMEEKVSGRFIGYFGFWRLDKEHCRAEIGYALHPDYWSNGFMQETFVFMLEFAFTKLKVHSLEAHVNVDNQASMRLLERNGFRQEAYFRENYLYKGKFLDSRIYCLLESDIKSK